MKKRTLAARAKEIGLDDAAQKVLFSAGDVSLDALVNAKVPGLEDVASVAKGVGHIVADVVAKDIENITFMDSL